MISPQRTQRTQRGFYDLTAEDAESAESFMLASLRTLRSLRRLKTCRRGRREVFFLRVFRALCGLGSSWKISLPWFGRGDRQAKKAADPGRRLAKAQAY